MPIHPRRERSGGKAGLPRGDRCRRGREGQWVGGETTGGGGGVGDGLEVWKDSENSRRHSSAPRACKFARIDSGRRGKRRGKEGRSERERERESGEGGEDENRRQARQRQKRD